jgi:hypothetical protein
MSRIMVVPERGAPTTKIGEVMVIADAIKSKPAIPRGTQVRVPDFFIVGQAKSGTTALYEMVREHPAIFMPKLKEPEFLASDMRRRFQPPMSGAVPATLEEYLALFTGAGADQLAGEATALYLSSHTAASSIAQLNPRARIIAIFREPASFLRSLHLQHLQNHNEDQRDLRRAIALEAARRDGRAIPRRSCRPQVLHYSDHVRYTEQLMRYHGAFAREQVLVLIYDDLRRDNAATVRKIFQFLEVDDAVPVVPVNANPTVTLRSQALDEAVHRLSVGRGRYSKEVKAAVKALLPRRAPRRLLSAVQAHVVHSSPPPADEQLMADLRGWMKPEVERLGAYLERDLVGLWGYDGVECSHGDLRA